MSRAERKSVAPTMANGLMPPRSPPTMGPAKACEPANDIVRTPTPTREFFTASAKREASRAMVSLSPNGRGRGP